MRGSVRLRHLDDLAERLMDSGLAASTRRAYRAGVHRYKRFCASHGLFARPAPETTILRFVAHCTRAGYTAARISGMLAGVRIWHVRRGTAWRGRTERIRLALKGAAKLPRSGQRPRIAATPFHLRALRSALRHMELQPADRAAAWAAVSLGFLGALRASEYLCPAALTIDPRHTCQWRHLTLSRGKDELVLPASKTDQLYAGTLVSLPALGGRMCPVNALRRYRRLVPNRRPDQPLFSRADGQGCTPAWLNRVLRDSHIDPQGRITSHSLRIGFATAAAAAGVPDATIQASGRWRGSSYLRYIRGPRLSVWEACKTIM